MAVPENIKQVLKAALFRIVLNSNNLVMSRHARTYVLVYRIVHKPMAIPNLCSRHARDSLVSQLQSPKATRAELRELLTWRRNIIVGSFGYCGGRRVLLGTRPVSEPVEEIVHRGFVDGDGTSGFGERANGFE